MQNHSRYLAENAIEYVKKALPFGSINKKTDMKNPNYKRNRDLLTKVKTELINIVLSEGNFESIGDGIFLNDLNRQADLYEYNKVGNCFEQCIVALRYLKNLDDSVVIDFCQIQESKHSFLIINGDLICDIWADSIYHVSEFEKNKCSSPIEYADEVADAFKLIGKNVVPYLEGTPVSLFSTNKSKNLAIKDGKFVHINNKVNANDVYNENSLFSSSKLTSTILNDDRNKIDLMKKYGLTDLTEKSLQKGLRNAAANNRIKDIKFFIKYTGNIDAKDTGATQKTALHWAVEKGHKEAYKLLIEAGAAVNIPDSKGETVEQLLQKNNLINNSLKRKNLD